MVIWRIDNYDDGEKNNNFVLETLLSVADKSGFVELKLKLSTVLRNVMSL